MAVSPLSSSLSLSRIIPFLSPSSSTNKTHSHSTPKSNTYLGFPLSSSSLSLYNRKTPTDRNGRLTITSAKPYNVQIVVDDDESEESMVYRFKREAVRAGVFQESRRRRFFETTQEKKKRKAREAAARRSRRRRFQQARTDEDRTETEKEEMFDFDNLEKDFDNDFENDFDDDMDDDNWELPEGDLPYGWN